jgi:hypothetical protein
MNTHKMITRFFIVCADHSDWREGPWPDLQLAKSEVRRMRKDYRAPDWFYFILEETYPDCAEGRRSPGWMVIRDVLAEQYRRRVRRNAA